MGKGTVTRNRRILDYLVSAKDYLQSEKSTQGKLMDLCNRAPIYEVPFSEVKFQIFEEPYDKMSIL